jgi:curved DNA-binding protein CbpA
MKWIVILAISVSLQAFGQSSSEILRIKSSKSTFYEVLGVSNTASEAEIKSAYRKLLRVYHPDHYPNNPAGMKAATEIMIRLNDARDTLTDSLKRKSYDITVKATSPLKPTAEKAASAWEKWTPTDFAKEKAAEEKVKPKAEPKTAEAPKAQPKAEPEVKVKKAEVRVETPSTAVTSSNSATSYKAKQALKAYTETSRCGVGGYVKTLVDVMN